jgi:YD repeat-containing protein
MNGLIDATEHHTIQRFDLYDIFGNAVKVTDGNGNTTLLYYGDNDNPFAFPDGDGTYPPCDPSKALDHSLITAAQKIVGTEDPDPGTPSDDIVSTTTYDILFQTPAQETDPNGNTVQRTYGPFGRPEQVTDPLGNNSTYEYYDTNDPSTTNLSYAKIRVPSSSGDLVNIVYSDGFNRSVMSQRKCEDPGHAGQDIYTKVYYDATGKLRDVFRPFYDSDSYDYGHDVGAVIAKVSRLFYTLEPAESARPDTICPDYVQQPELRKEIYYRSQDLAYSVTRIKDLGGKWTETWLDKLGNKVRVKSNSEDGETYQNEAVFTYSTVGDLLTVTDAEGKGFASKYDRLSRRTAYASPDMYVPGGEATWDISWEYDGVGNVKAYVDPNLVAADLQLKYEYDELNRMTRNYVADGSIDIHYDYDEYEEMGIDWDAIVDIDGEPIPRTFVDNAKGRLTRVSSTGNDRIEIRLYSKRGQRVSHALRI